MEKSISRNFVPVFQLEKFQKLKLKQLFFQFISIQIWRNKAKGDLKVDPFINDNRNLRALRETKCSNW